MLKESQDNHYNRIGKSISLERITVNDHSIKYPKYSTETIRTLDLPKAIIKNNRYIKGSEFELLPKEMTTKSLCFVYASSYSIPKEYYQLPYKGHKKGKSCHAGKATKKVRSKLLNDDHTIKGKGIMEEEEEEEEEKKENIIDEEEDQANKIIRKGKINDAEVIFTDTKHILTRNTIDMKQNTCQDPHMITISFDDQIDNKQATEDRNKEKDIDTMQPPQIRKISINLRKKHNEVEINEDKEQYNTLYKHSNDDIKEKNDNQNDHVNKTNNNSNAKDSERKTFDKTNCFTTEHIEDIFYQNISRSPMNNYCIEQQHNTLYLPQSPTIENNGLSDSNNNTIASNNNTTTTPYNAYNNPKCNTKPLPDYVEKYIIHNQDKLVTSSKELQNRKPFKVSTATQMTDGNDDPPTNNMINSYNQMPLYDYQNNKEPQHEHCCIHHHHQQHCSYQAKVHEMPLNQPKDLSIIICRKCGKSRSPEPMQKIHSKNHQNDFQMKLNSSKASNIYSTSFIKQNESKSYTNVNETKKLLIKNNMFEIQKPSENVILFKPRNFNRNTNYDIEQNYKDNSNSNRTQNNKTNTKILKNQHIPYTQEIIIIPPQNNHNYYQRNASRNIIQVEDQNCKEIYGINYNDNNQVNNPNNKHNDYINIEHQREMHKSSSTPYFIKVNKAYKPQSIHSIVRNNIDTNNKKDIMNNYDYSHYDSIPKEVPIQRTSSMNQPQNITSYCFKPQNKTSTLNDYKSIPNYKNTSSSNYLNKDFSRNNNKNEEFNYDQYISKDYSSSIANNVSTNYINDHKKEQKKQYKNRCISSNNHQLTYQMDSHDDIDIDIDNYNNNNAHSFIKKQKDNSININVNNDIRTKYPNRNNNNNKLITRNTFLQMQIKPISPFNNF